MCHGYSLRAGHKMWIAVILSAKLCCELGGVQGVDIERTILFFPCSTFKNGRRKMEAGGIMMEEWEKSG